MKKHLLILLLSILSMTAFGQTATPQWKKVNDGIKVSYPGKSPAGFDTLYSLAKLRTIFGYTNRTFSPVVVFDAPFKSTYTQTGNITFSLGASPVNDVTGRISIIGDGTHSVTFPGPPAWNNVNGQLFDNTMQNDIYFENVNGKISYSINHIATPDVTAPLLATATVSNATPTQIVLAYSELLDVTSVPAIGDFSVNLSKAVTAVSVTGSLVTITVNSAFVYGDAPTISYTAAGNPIQDPSHNHAVNLSTQAVTNNILPATVTMSITNSTQIPATTVIPANFAFGSSGTDVPMSVSFWAKHTGSTGTFVSIQPITGSGPGFVVQNVSGNVYFQLFTGTGGSQMYINSNTSLTNNVWNFITVTYDGTKSASGMKIYFNGTLQASTTGIASYAGQTPFVTGTVLAVMSTAGGTAGEYNNCKMGQVYLWNKELTTGDITAIYNGGHLVDPTILTIIGNLIGRYELSGDLTDQGANHYNMSSSTAPIYSVDVP